MTIEFATLLYDHNLGSPGVALSGCQRALEGGSSNAVAIIQEKMVVQLERQKRSCWDGSTCSRQDDMSLKDI